MKQFVTSFLAIFFLIAPAVGASFLPNDTFYNYQWYLSRIKAPAAWEQVNSSPDITIAVIDAGIDINHPDLKDNIWKNVKEIPGNNIDDDANGFIDDVNGWDFVQNIPDPSPKFDEGWTESGISHGTTVAGIIAATGNNREGVTGISWKAKLMPLRALNDRGEGRISSVIRAMDYAVSNGADIINLSLVGFEKSAALEDAILRAHRNGVLIVAASGNSESGKEARDLDLEPAYPVCYGLDSDNTVLGVASIGLTDEKSVFSNYGSTCVDVSTLGERLISLAYYNPGQNLNDYYSYNWYGTSFSTAIVSGMAALIKSKNLSLDASDIINILVDNTTDINDVNNQFIDKLGSGKVNIIESLNNTSQTIGKLIKLDNSNSIYYLDQSQTRHLFSNQNVFFSWYNGNWSDQDIEIVSQSKFDTFTVGNNIVIRPGTKLIKFQNSGRIYAVSAPNVLHYVDNDVLKKLYGEDYASRLVTMQNSFEADYFYGGKLDGSSYPSSSLIQYSNSDTIWYIDNESQREFLDNSFSLNSFSDQDVIRNVSLDFSYEVSSPIKNLNSSLFPYFK